MKPREKCTLFETRRLPSNKMAIYTENNQLWECVQYIVYDDNTEQVVKLSHHATKREAEEQNTINKHNFWKP